MEHMDDDDIGGIVRDMQLKVELLDGWRAGESERCDRLERAVARVALEVALLRQETRAEFGSIRAGSGSVYGEFASVQPEFAGLRGQVAGPLEATS